MGFYPLAYKWAKEQPGRAFKFHALVWGSQYPDFLCKKKNPSITIEQTRQYITEWFDAVAAKFPDLEYIDVVNEAMYVGDNYHSGFGKPAAGAEGHSTDDTECGGSYIVEALGGDRVVNGKHQYDFIVTAFKMARERWPNAVLIYNDYNTIKWQKDQGIELIQTILANGAPVDAYGNQAHDCKGMSKSDFERTLTEIHDKTGLPLLISEYDISEANDEAQKNDFANQIPFMWETEWIGGITIWGYINGATWVENTGLIQPNGQDRASMTWLKQYFRDNLNKGKNTTGLSGAAPDPVPQEPFKGTPLAIPGKIEMEDFDITGVGTGNNSYNDADSENHGDSDYRKDTGVDLYKKATGVVVGYNDLDDWLEYTVDVKEAGEYTVFAAVAAAAEGASFKLSANGTDITQEIAIPAATAGEENYDDYNKVSANVSLSAGKQIIRFTITGTWLDIDYMTFVKGSNAADPEPILPPSPQEPFKGFAVNVPGKIEAEDFDIPGVGQGNESYSDADAENHGDSDYRNDAGVDLYKKATGVVVGYNDLGDWLEYTIDVEETGDYTMFAAVAAAAEGASFQLSIDGTNITEEIAIPAAKSGEENYDDYNKVSANVKLSAGKQILRLTITGTWLDIDYMTFVKGAGATDPEPIDSNTTIIAQDLQLNRNVLSDYDIFDMQGVRLGRLSAYSWNQAIHTVTNSSFIQSNGVYFIRSKTTSKMKSVRIAR